MKIRLDQNPIFYKCENTLRAKFKSQGKSVECLIVPKRRFFKYSLSIFDKCKNRFGRLLFKNESWVLVKIKDGALTQNAYIRKNVFETQEFDKLVSKLERKALKTKKTQATKTSKASKPLVKQIKEDAPSYAPALYALDRVKIDKATSFEDLRQIACKYLKKPSDIKDFQIIEALTKRLEELKKDPFGKHEREVLNTLYIKYQNAEIPHLHISLKQIQDAQTQTQRQELIRQALNLPQDASVKMVQMAVERTLKQFKSDKKGIAASSLELLNHLCFLLDQPSSRTA